MDPTTHAILSAIGTLVAARVVAAVRRAWQRRRGVTGPRYAELYARLTRSPAARRVWQG